MRGLYNATPRRCRTASSAARCVDQDATRAVFGGDPAEALAKPLMESIVEALKPVGGGRSGGDSRQPDLDRQIEDQSEIRGKAAEGEMVQGGERIKRNFPAVALVGEGRIGEAVGDHPCPLRQRRLDQSGHMIAPGGDQQQGLPDRIPALALAFEQQSPDRFRTRRSAGLAGRASRNPRPRECGDEQPDLGRLAGALAPLDGDEPAPCRRSVPLGVQRRWPQTR